MKIKNLLVFGLVGIIVMAGAGAVFADTTVNFTRGQGLGEGISSQYNTIEERFEAKIALISQMVKDGKLTAEKGEELKALLRERIANCDESGTFKNFNDRLGLGFGKTNEIVQNKRQGALKGARNGFGSR